MVRVRHLWGQPVFMPLLTELEMERGRAVTINMALLRSLSRERIAAISRCALRFRGKAGWGSPGGAAGESFHQPEELSDLPDFFLERFAREFLPHLQFHDAGSLSLCRRRMFSNFFWSRPAC